MKHILFILLSAGIALLNLSAGESAMPTPEMLPGQPVLFGRPASDRNCWNAMSTRCGNLNRLVERTEKLSSEFKVDLSASCYSNPKDFARYPAELQRTIDMLTRLTAVECLEYKGRFLPAISALVAQIQTAPSWVSFHHDRSGRTLKGARFSDLLATELGATLATSFYLLGDKLPETTRTAIRSMLEEWILSPYRKSMRAGAPVSGMWWLTSGNNWNAVCNANTAIVAAALVTDRNERAEFFRHAILSTKKYLAGFSDDGYCSEGMSYWNYGLNHYLILCELLYQVTDGKINLYQGDDKLQRVFRFGLDVELAPGVYPAFADCPTSVKLKYPLTTLLAVRAKLPDYAARSRFPWGTIPHWNAMESCMIFDLLAHAPALPKTAAALPQNHVFPNGGVVIAGRGTPAALAVKAGHNGEFHNHNDVGSFVWYAKKEPLLTDPGYP
ncbi:MAG: heparinase II/III family protein [Victivallaceae bacterium]|nr:heparinase II/III family protein [Victivallaceae bacterium]